jgi:hypothetical protein
MDLERRERHFEILQKAAMPSRFCTGTHQRARSQPSGERRQLLGPADPKNNPAGGRELELSRWHRRSNLYFSLDRSVRSLHQPLAWP